MLKKTFLTLLTNRLYQLLHDITFAVSNIWVQTDINMSSEALAI
jgi:hypothetical protein